MVNFSANACTGKENLTGFMRFAIVSRIGDFSGFAYVLALRGHKVFLWTLNEVKYLEGVRNIEHERGITLLSFLKKHKDDFLVFDGQEFGIYQQLMRRGGAMSIGSSVFGARIESSRYAQYKVAKAIGVRIPETRFFESIDEAISFLKKEKKRYVLKQNRNLPKSFNYVAEFDDSYDLILHLEALKKRYPDIQGNFVLQRFVDGVEVATSGFYTSRGWLKGGMDVLLEVNFEHKSLIEGDRGIMTGEMGTVAWFIEGENRIFNEMVKPLEPLLEKFGNCGPVDANCIVDENGDIYLLEWTIRFGYPISDLYTELCPEPDRFLISIYTGEKVSVKEYPTVGIVWVLGFPIFPYEKAKDVMESFIHEPLIFTSEEALRQFRPGFVNWDGTTWVISDDYGYAGTIVLSGTVIEDVMERGVKLIQSIVPSRKGFYRTDIGARVIEALKKDYVVEAIFPL